MSHDELGDITKQAIELAGGQAAFDALLNAKHTPKTKTLETLCEATEAVLADLQSGAVVSAPAPISPPLPVAANTTDEHFAVYAAITDPAERGNYYQKHLAAAFGQGEEFMSKSNSASTTVTFKEGFNIADYPAASERTKDQHMEVFAAIIDPNLRGEYWKKHSDAINARFSVPTP